MNFFRLLLFTCLLLSLPASPASGQQDASGAFFAAYQEYQRAERLEREGRNDDAIAKFRYVASQLGQIKSKNPDWQPLVIDFRLRKTQEAIVRLEGALDSPTLGPPPDLAVMEDDETLPPVRPPRRESGQAGPTISIMPGEQQGTEPAPPKRSQVNPPPTGDSESLRRQVAAERQRAADLERQIQRGEAELLSVSMELEKTKVAVVDLGTQLRQFKEAGLPPSGDTAEQEKLRTAAAEMEAALAAANADKEQLEARAQESTKQVESLNAKLAAAEQAASDAAQSKAEAEQFRTEAESAKAEATSAKAEADTVKEEIKAAKTSAETAKAEMDAAKKRLADAETALKKAEDLAARGNPALVDTAKKEVEAALREIKDLTLNLAELERERAELIASRDVAQRRFVEARGGGDMSAELVEANRQLESRLSEATRQLARMERDTTVKDLTQRVTELERERSELVASREVAQQQAAEASEVVEKNNSLIEANRQLEEKLAAEQATGADTGNSVKELAQRLTEMEKERSELIASRDAAQQQFAEAKATADQSAALLETNRQLEEKLAAAVAEAAKADTSGALKELAEQVKALEKERAELLTARDSTAKELADAKSAAEKTAELVEANRLLEEKLATASAPAPELEELRSKIADLEKEKAELIASRDSAQQELAQAKTSADGNSELIEAKRQLEEKLAAASEQITGLQTDASAKAEVIAGLQSDLESVKTQLAEAQTKLKDDKERFDKLQAINDQLLKEYDQVTGALAAVQLGDVTAAEARMLQQENEVLRGIVMRQVKEQARREQVFRLAQEELQRLEINSGTLSEKINELGQPTLELSPAEQEMLKRPVITLLDADAAKMTAQIEVLKPQPTPDAEQQGAVSTEQPAPTPAPTPDQAPPSESASAAASLSLELSPQMQAVLGQARDEFVRGNFAKAEELYLEFVQKHPDNIIALANLGVAQFRQGKLTAAQLALERAVKLSPNDAFSLTTLGAVLIEQGRIEDAVNYLERSNTSVADDPITLNYLGVASSQLGQFGKAEQSLRRAITVKPNYAEAHFNLAVIYATAKPPSIALAKRHYEKALELGAPPDGRLAAMLQAASGS